eukprot:757580-Hanusia_phi.AAC.2
MPPVAAFLLPCPPPPPSFRTGGDNPPTSRSQPVPPSDTSPLLTQVLTLSVLVASSSRKARSKQLSGELAPLSINELLAEMGDALSRVRSKVAASCEQDT